MKTIVTIQDLSCYGKCALANALPVLNVMGLAAAPLPTALLSAHTGFGQVYLRDLTEDMTRILDAWSRDRISFDAALCGYLASPDQAAAVSRVFSEFVSGMKILDPAMGDGGHLYRGIGEDMVRAVSALAGTADVIVPNLTEAALLTGTAYNETPCRDGLTKLLRSLLSLGPRTAVITGVKRGRDEIGAAALALDPATGRETFSEAYAPLCPLSYHGTGDLFAACLAGSLVRGDSLPDAVSLAVRFTAGAISVSPADPAQEKHGVEFEKVLRMLLPGQQPQQ